MLISEIDGITFSLKHGKENPNYNIRSAESVTRIVYILNRVVTRFDVLLKPKIRRQLFHRRTKLYFNHYNTDDNEIHNYVIIISSGRKSELFH